LFYSSRHIYIFGWWFGGFFLYVIFTTEKWLGGFLKTAWVFFGSPTNLHQSSESSAFQPPTSKAFSQPSYEGYCHGRIGSFISIRLGGGTPYGGGKSTGLSP